MTWKTLMGTTCMSRKFDKNRCIKAANGIERGPKNVFLFGQTVALDPWGHIEVPWVNKSASANHNRCLGFNSSLIYHKTRSYSILCLSIGGLNQPCWVTHQWCIHALCQPYAFETLLNGLHDTWMQHFEWLASATLALTTRVHNGTLVSLGHFDKTRVMLMREICNQQLTWHHDKNWTGMKIKLCIHICPVFHGTKIYTFQ